jgi:predicted nucleotidyltransferase
MKLHKDLREFVALLNSAGVRYVIVGGHAVAFHGHPRYTGDIDFFIERSEDNAARVEKVLRDFGFGQTGFQAKDFLEPESVVQLGRPPNRIDLLTTISGVSFPEAWANRVSGLLDDIPVSFLGRDDLLKNKRASGRPQDLADLSHLE